MRIAVAGCLHGELNKIYSDIKQRDDKVQLLLVCGDFQSLRNENDFKCLAVPKKFQVLGDFHEYYKGKRSAPILTLFVGGNHEASNYLASLAFGGWIAHNIYYMGYASVVNFNGLRIGGVSGIYKKHDASCGHYESLPYDESSKRSVYHTREVDVYKLMQLSVSQENPQPIDVMLSHDWPLNIHTCGDVGKLLRAKPFFRQDIDNNHLGNPLYQPVIPYLKPRFWFSAHLHVKFEAFIDHADNVSTKFLSLDKPIGRRHYLDILDIKPQSEGGEPVLKYDLEWLSILKKTDRFTSIDRIPSPRVPEFQTWGYETKRFISSPQDIEKISSILNDDLRIPHNFKMTEPVLEDSDTDPNRVRNFTNHQTTTLCTKLGIRDPVELVNDRLQPKPNPDQINPDQIDLDEIEEDQVRKQPKPNPDQIDLDDEIEEDQVRKRVRSNDAEEAFASGQLFVIDKVGNR